MLTSPVTSTPSLSINISTSHAFVGLVLVYPYGALHSTTLYFPSFFIFQYNVPVLYVPKFPPDFFNLYPFWSATNPSYSPATTCVGFTHVPSATDHSYNANVVSTAVTTLLVNKSFFTAVIYPLHGTFLNSPVTCWLCHGYNLVVEYILLL